MFSKSFDSLLFRSCTVATLIIVAAMFAVGPKVGSKLADIHCPNIHLQANEAIAEKAFFGVAPEGWTAISTAGLFFATVALSVVTYLLFRTAARETKKTEEALKIAMINAESSIASVEVARQALVADNRAWLSCDVRITSPLTYDERGAQISFDLILHNFGRSVALNVWPASHVLTIKPGNSPDYTKQLREMCSPLPTHLIGTPIESMFRKKGYFVFPGESFMQESRIIISNEEITSSLIDRKHFSLVLLAGVAYDYPGDEASKMTGVAFKIERLAIRDGVEHQVMMDITIGDVPLHELRVTRSFMGGHIAT